MEVIQASEMARIEKLAFEEGASGDAFMQKAATGIAQVINQYVLDHHLEKKITLVAGKGNNGGDAFCMALTLLEKGFEIEVYHLYPLEECSELCQKYGRALSEKIEIKTPKTAEDIELPQEGILVDGILGTGFKGEPTRELQLIFNHLNQTRVPLFAIDIPSGLNGDTGEVVKAAIIATHTIFLGLPKKGFFIREGWNHVGELIHVDFGLDHKYVSKAHVDFELLQENEIRPLFPKVIRNRHKYEAGFVVGISGSKGMMGASLLSGMAALRSGAGMVKLIHLEEEFNNPSVYPELIHKTISCDQVDLALEIMEKATAVYIGPGIGLEEGTIRFLKALLPRINKPCVIDADALTIIAQEKLSFPKETIITPHIGEMHRLLGKKPEDPFEIYSLCQEYANHHQIIVLLKGGPSFIFRPNRVPEINPTGDPGMATAGSGDVLTGIIAGLLSQIGMNTESAATLGVYLHGRVGEIAAKKKSSYSVVASDLVKYLYKVFKV